MAEGGVRQHGSRLSGAAAASAPAISCIILQYPILLRQGGLPLKFKFLWNQGE